MCAFGSYISPLTLFAGGHFLCVFVSLFVPGSFTHTLIMVSCYTVGSIPCGQLTPRHLQSKQRPVTAARELRPQSPDGGVYSFPAHYIMVVHTRRKKDRHQKLIFQHSDFSFLFIQIVIVFFFVCFILFVCFLKILFLVLRTLLALRMVSALL